LKFGALPAKVLWRVNLELGALNLGFSRLCDHDKANLLISHCQGKIVVKRVIYGQKDRMPEQKGAT
jgi:hypothetical protein